MTGAEKPGRVLDLDSPFWRFALRVYAQPGVAPLCLTLQDENGIDVNLLLFACWCGSTGRKLRAQDVEIAAAATSEWTEGVVRNLRAARRHWKAIGPDEPSARAGRETLKSVELLSERIVCAMLFGIAGRLGSVGDAMAPLPDAIAANLSQVLQCASVAKDGAEAASRLLVEACMAAG